MRPEIEKVFDLIDNDYKAIFYWPNKVISKTKEFTICLTKDKLEFCNNGDVSLFVLCLDSYESSIAEKILKNKKNLNIRRNGTKNIEELKQLLKNIDGKST